MTPPPGPKRIVGYNQGFVGMGGTREFPIARRRRASFERGDSLIEVLITVSIVGLGVVAIMTAVGATLQLSGTNRVGAHADQLLVRYAENLSGVPYEACTAGSTPYAGAATSAIPSSNLPDGITVGAPGTAAAQSNAFELSIHSVSYWNGDVSPATFSSTCPSSDLGSQELNLLVHAGNGSLDRTVTIVKRAP
jgi:Tfp pilus assembly protein PilV